MNAKKLFMVISVAAMMFLTGCQAGQQGSQPDQNKQTAPLGAQTRQQEAVAVVDSYSASDRAAYSGAQQLKDPSFCDKISDENYKKACRDTVNDQNQLENAVAKNDSKLCASIISQDKQRACTIQLDVIRVEKEKIAQEEKIRETTGKLRDQIIKAGDLSRCREIKIEGKRAECEIAILTKKVSTTKDASWCDKASTGDLKAQCKEIASKLK